MLQSKNMDKLMTPPTLREHLYKALDSRPAEYDDVALEDFLAAFQDEMIEDHRGSSKYFARAVAFVQSSGSGKTRLIRGCALRVPSFTITVAERPGAGQSLPEDDAEVCGFLQRRARSWPQRVVIAAFMSALFNQLFVRLVASYNCQGYDVDGKTKPELVGVKTFEVDKSAGDDEVHLAKKQRNSSFYEELYRELSGEEAKTILLQCARVSHAAKNAVQKIKAEKSLRVHICQDLYSLRQTAEKNKERTQLLRSVIKLAGAILDNDASTKNFDDGYKYIGKTGLLGNIDRLFDLIDSAKGSNDTLSKKAKTKGRKPQFIFGFDECVSMDGLLNSHYKIETLPPGLPQGIFAAYQLLHDLNTYSVMFMEGYLHSSVDLLDGLLKPEAANKSTELFWLAVDDAPRKKVHDDYSDYIGEPFRRIWLAMLDTTSNAKMPPVKPVKLEPSYRLMSNPIPFVRSVWNKFGMDHGIRVMLSQDKNLFQGMSIDALHSFETLKLMGRGLFNAYPQNRVLNKSLRMVLNDSKSLKDVKIFDSEYCTRITRMDLVTFSVASLRFNLDSGFTINNHGDEFQYSADSLAKHMRVLIKASYYNTIETSTPSEPMLAISALLLLNYGKDILRDYLKETPVANFRIRLPESVTRSDDGWKKMLEEMRSQMSVHPILVVIGDSGELIARMILTRAKDCTLPQEYDLRSKQFLWTRLELFFENLLGKEAADEAFAKVREKELRLRKSLVNFIQFVPMFSLVKDANWSVKATSLIGVNQLSEAFCRQAAFICPPNENGIDLVCPIMIPNEATALLVAANKEASTILSDYQPSAVGFDVQMREEKQDDGALWSPSVVDEVTKAVVSPCLPIVILMDQGVEAPFLNKEDGVGVYVKSEMENEGLEIRVNGLEMTYPCFKEIDTDGIFVKNMRTTMARQRSLYKETMPMSPTIFIPKD